NPSGAASTAVRTTAARSSSVNVWYSPSDPLGTMPVQPPSARKRTCSAYRSRSTARSDVRGSGAATRTPCQGRGVATSWAMELLERAGDRSVLCNIAHYAIASVAEHSPARHSPAGTGRSVRAVAGSPSPGFPSPGPSRPGSPEAWSLAARFSERTDADETEAAPQRAARATTATPREDRHGPRRAG